jgi:hypothetical protein
MPMEYDARLPFIYDFQCLQDLLEHFKHFKHPRVQEIENLINAISVPGYLVYDYAYLMFTCGHINDTVGHPDSFDTSKISEYFTFNNDERSTEDVENIKRVFTSYILTKCIVSLAYAYLVSLKPSVYISDSFAVNYVFFQLLEEQTGDKQSGGAIDDLTGHLANAFSCFRSVQKATTTKYTTCKPNWWWWKSDNRVHVDHSVETQLLARMHPANFIVQHNDDRVCGYIATLTMLSKSTDLCNVFKSTIKRHDIELRTIKDLIASNPTHNIHPTITNWLDRKLARLLFNKNNIEQLLEDCWFLRKTKRTYIRKQQENIALLNAEILHITLLKSNGKNTEIVQHVNQDIARNKDYIKIIEVLFNMSGNADVLSRSTQSDTSDTSDTSQFTRHYLSINFDQHRLLDQLGSLFPQSLQWLPYGTTIRVQYVYAISLFLAAGLASSDIAFVRTTKQNNAIYTTAKNTNVPRLYVHIISDTGRDLATLVPRPHIWTDPFRTKAIITNNQFQFVDQVTKHTYTLGGFVFGSVQDQTHSPGHAICGFRDANVQYVYDGNMKNNRLPCPPTQVEWLRLISSTTGYYIDHDCGFKEISTNQQDQNNIVQAYKYPFGGFAGFGIVDQHQAKEATQPIPIPIHMQVIRDMWCEYDRVCKLAIQKQFIDILKKVTILYSTHTNQIQVLALDELYEASLETRTLFMASMMEDKDQPQIQINIMDRPPNLHDCVSFIVRRLFAQALDLEHIMLAQLCDTATNILSDDDVTNVSYAWVVKVLLFIAATELHSFNACKPLGTMDYSSTLCDVDSIIHVVCNKARNIHDPACIACEYLNYRNLNQMPIVELEYIADWVITKASVYIHEEHISLFSDPYQTLYENVLALVKPTP